MRDNTKYNVLEICKKYRDFRPRPREVDEAIERFYKEKDTNKRELLYELIELERVVSEWIHLYSNNY